MTADQTLADRSNAVAAYAAAQVGGPYIMGATAEACTPTYRKALAAGRSSNYADMIYACCPVLSGQQVSCEGCGWRDKPAHDCAQLTRFAAEAAGLTLPSGATSQWRDGDWAASGLVEDLPRGYVCMVYRRSSGRMVHTGIYMGDGTVIEARGHKDGVIRSELGDYPWTHWAILRGMRCPEDAGLLQERPVLRKGARGGEVARLQEALVSAGYSVGSKGTDGVFGAATREAVMELQRDAGISVDGVVGEQTWAALGKLASSTRWTVTISGLTGAAAQRIVGQYGGQMSEEDEV